MSAFGIGLYHAGVGMGYLYVMMGVIISSCVIPATLTLIWKDQNWVAAAFAPLLGLATSLIAWLVTAKSECGELTVSCTGSNYPMLAGNVAALLSPMIYVPVLTFVFGRQNYDWKSMQQINIVDESDQVRVDPEDPTYNDPAAVIAQDEHYQSHLMKAAKIARWMTVVMTVCFLVLWPMPLYGSGYVFSKPFFTGWVTVSFIWLFCTTLCVGVFPVWQSRKTLFKVTRGMVCEAMGKGRPPVVSGREIAVAENVDVPVKGEDEKP